MLRAALIAGVSMLAACMPPREPPGDRGYFGSPRRVRVDAPPSPDGDPRPAPTSSRIDGPRRAPSPPTASAPGPSGPLLDAERLPTPWDATLFDVLAPRLTRTVVASEDVVGVAATPEGLLAVEAGGGLFRVDPFDRLLPRPTPLSHRVARMFADDDLLVLCSTEAVVGRFSVDAGAGWASLSFPCSDGEGRRTLAGAGRHIFALVDGALRVGPLPRGRYRLEPLPIADPRALGAADERLVVFGAHEVARSVDSGRHFAVAPRPLALEVVRDVLFVGKATVLAAGRAAHRPSGSAMVRSADGGRTWRTVSLPRRLDDIQALALGGDGRVLAVPTGAAAGAAVSVDGGRTWREAPPQLLAAGAAIAHAGGFVTGSPRGILASLDTAAPRLGLEEPLHAVIYTHPRVAVGVGQQGGLYLSRDGGRTWWGRPAWADVRFADVARIAGHGLMVVGDGVLWRSEDAGARFDQRPIPNSCRARWVRFDGPQGLVGCADGGMLQSRDGGEGWRPMAPPPTPVRPVVFLEDGLLALTQTGRFASRRPAAEWRLRDAPLPAAVELRPWKGGASLLAADGRIALRRAEERVWRAAPLQGREILRDPIGHRVLADESVLVLDALGLVHLSADAPPRRIAPATAGHAFHLTGDGGVLLLEDMATTLFAP